MQRNALRCLTGGLALAAALPLWAGFAGTEVSYPLLARHQGSPRRCGTPPSGSTTPPPPAPTSPSTCSSARRTSPPAPPPTRSRRGTQAVRQRGRDPVRGRDLRRPAHHLQRPGRGRLSHLLAARDGDRRLHRSVLRRRAGLVCDRCRRVHRGHRRLADPARGRLRLPLQLRVRGGHRQRYLPGTVTVKDASGGTLGSKTYTVRQWEQVQKGLRDEFPSISDDNVRLTVTVTSGSGRVIAFGSSVSNGMQDPSTLEMAYADSLLAENSSSGGISGVTAGAGLTGGGSSGTVTLAVGAGQGIQVSADTVALADPGVTKQSLGLGRDEWTDALDQRLEPAVDRPARGQRQRRHHRGDRRRGSRRRRDHGRCVPVGGERRDRDSDARRRRGDDDQALSLRWRQRQGAQVHRLRGGVGR